MAHSHALRDNTGMIAGIAALSAGIGAVAALLFTPRTGEQVRSGLKRRAHNTMDTMSDKMHSAKDTADDMADSIKDNAKDMAENNKQAAQNVTRTARQKKDELK